MAEQIAETIDLVDRRQIAEYIKEALAIKKLHPEGHLYAIGSSLYLSGLKDGATKKDLLSQIGFLEVSPKHYKMMPTLQNAGRIMCLKDRKYPVYVPNVGTTLTILAAVYPQFDKLLMEFEDVRDAQVRWVGDNCLMMSFKADPESIPTRYGKKSKHLLDSTMHQYKECQYLMLNVKESTQEMSLVLKERIKK